MAIILNIETSSPVCSVCLAKDGNVIDYKESRETNSHARLLTVLIEDLLKENNIAVPDQVALVGFSNETYTSFTDPSLSTVEQHSMRIGNAAAEIFLEEVNADQKKFIPQKIVLKPELIIRQSSLRKK